MPLLQAVYAISLFRYTRCQAKTPYRRCNVCIIHTYTNIAFQLSGPYLLIHIKYRYIDLYACTNTWLGCFVTATKRMYLVRFVYVMTAFSRHCLMLPSRQAVGVRMARKRYLLVHAFLSVSRFCWISQYVSQQVTVLLNWLWQLLCLPTTLLPTCESTVTKVLRSTQAAESRLSCPEPSKRWVSFTVVQVASIVMEI